MMSWIADNYMQLALAILYGGMLFHHARSGQRRTSNLSDFLVAGRGMGGGVIGLSYYATFLSTNTFIGQAGKSWSSGLIWYSKAAVYGVMVYAAWYVVAPRFVEQTRRLGSLTVADYLGYRYNSSLLRRVAALVIFVSSTVYLVAVYKGASGALSEFLKIDYGVALLIIFLVVTAYTLTGGFRSVVLTDAVQGVLMAIGAVALPVAILVHCGGLTAAIERLGAEQPQLVSWQAKGDMSLWTILGIALSGGLKFMVEPRQLSRFYGLKDDKALRTARRISPVLVLLTYLCLLPVGAFARLVIPSDSGIQDSDEVIPYLLGTAHLFGPLLSTLFLLVLVSAAMSSLDSVLLVAASSMEHDLLHKDRPEHQAIHRTRIWVVSLSLLAMAIAFNRPSDIVNLTALSGSFYGACFFAPLVFGLYWNGGTSRAALCCIAAGSSVVSIWFYLRQTNWIELHEIYAGLVVGITVFLVVSWSSPRNRGQGNAA